MARTTVIEDKLFGPTGWLNARSSVVAACHNRIYPWMKVPQGVLKPYVTYHRVTGLRVRSLAGPTTLLMHPTIQIDVWGEYGTVKPLADAIRQDLEQTLPGQVLGGYRVQACLVHDDHDDADAPLHGSEETETRVTMDATVWFEEDTA